MAGRTNIKWARIYINNYPLCAYTQSIGPLVWENSEVDMSVICDDAKGYYPNQATVTPTALNGVMDPAIGSHFSGFANNYDSLVITTVLGIKAEPVLGDPLFTSRSFQSGFTSGDNGGLVTANMQFGGYDYRNSPGYSKPWGVLLAPWGNYTAINSGTGADDHGAQTAYGGYMVYNLAGSDGTATIKIQDAATNSDGSFSDLAGATTGVVDWTTNISSGYIALATNAVVRRYLRYQIVLGTANYWAGLIGFVRSLGPGH